MKKNQKTALAVLASVSLIVGTSLVGCGKSATSNAFMNRKTPIETQAVKLADIGGGQVFSGQITPETLTNVASKISGKVTAMQVHVGDHVTTGQALANIDTSQLQQQLQQSQSTVALNEAQANQAKDNQANNLASANVAVESSQANLAKAQTDHENSIVASQQAVDNARLALQKAQSDRENNLALAQQALDAAQASLDMSKTNHSAAVASAQEQLNEAQATYNNQKSGNDNKIQQLQIAVQQAQNSYTNALNALSQFSSGSQSVSMSNQIDTTYANLLQAQLNLKQAQSDPTLDPVLQEQLQKAQLALQTAQNAKDVDVATANYNQALEKLNQSQNDSTGIDQSQQQYNQSSKNLQIAQGNTSGIDIAKAQLDQSKQSLNAAQSTDGIAVAQAQLNVAQTTVQVISEQLQDGVLKAPVDGVVTAINSPVGQMAGGANSVVTIASTDPTIATVNVPEAAIGKIKIGTPMFVQIPTLNTTVEGKVLHIHPTLDAVTKSYGVDIQVDDPNHQLLPGMFTEATLKSEGKQAIMVPADSVLNEANGNSVFVDVNGKAKKVVVKIGEMTSTQYEITSGLHVGDVLVVKGEELLSDGMPVQDVTKSKQTGRSSAPSKDTKTGSSKTESSSSKPSTAGGKQ